MIPSPEAVLISSHFVFLYTLVGARGQWREWEGEMRELVFNGDRVSVLEGKKNQEMGDGELHNKLNVLSATGLYN